MPGETTAAKLEWLCRIHGCTSLIPYAEHLKRSEQWLDEAQAFLDERQERIAIQRSQPDRFYRWER